MIFATGSNWMNNDFASDICMQYNLHVPEKEVTFAV